MNKERLNEVIEYIKEHPEAHNQRSWTNINEPRTKKEGEVTINCGTTGCLAGHGAFRFAPPYTIFYYESLQIPNGELTYYEKYGKAVFDLTTEEADYLFDSDRSIGEIERFVNDQDFHDSALRPSYCCPCCDPES